MSMDHVRKRVEEIRAATERGRVLSPERAQQIKTERAGRYASFSRESAGEDETGLEVVTFEVGEEGLAVPAAETIGIVRWGDVQSLPLTPPCVPCAVKFRGQAVMVLALHVLQGRPVPQPTSETRLVVVEWRAGSVALLADAVHRGRRVLPTDLRPGGSRSWLDSSSARGVMDDGVTLLDIEQLALQLDRRLHGSSGRSPQASLDASGGTG